MSKNTSSADQRNSFVDKILQELKIIKSKYIEGINVMRMIPVSDHTKLFQALETLLSGFKSLEQLDDFVQESYERVILHVDDASNIDIINVESHNNDQAKKFGIKIREEANVQQTRACSSKSKEEPIFEYDSGNNEIMENDETENTEDFWTESDNEDAADNLLNDIHLHPLVEEKFTPIDKSLEFIISTSTVRKSKNDYKDMTQVLPVKTKEEWAFLNHRAEAKDPVLKAHMESFSIPEDWMSKILKEEFLLQFEDNSMDIISSPVFRLLFEQWNQKLADSFYDPKYCCRTQLLHKLRKCNYKMREKIRKRKISTAKRIERLKKKGDTKKLKLVEAKDLKDTKRLEALSQRSQDRKENRRGVKKLNKSSNGEQHDQSQNVKRINKGKVHNHLLRNKEKKYNKDQSDKEEKE